MISNGKLAKALAELANTLYLSGENKFKVRAYRRAAENISRLEENVEERVRRGAPLTEIPGIGEGIASTIEDVLRTGKSEQMTRLKKELSPDVAEVGKFPGLDPRQVLRVYKKLGIHSLRQLRRRLGTGEVKAVFGERFHTQLESGLSPTTRKLLYSVRPFAEDLSARLSALRGIERVSTCGGVRRGTDTVEEVSFLVSGKNRRGNFRAIDSMPTLERVKGGSESHCVYRGWNDIDVNIHWCDPNDHGLELLLLTGSSEHTAALERRAKVKKYRLTAPALRAAGVDTADETAIYRSLGLDFITPELRENTGELTAARRPELPRLVSLEDIRGDVHMHTTASDGAASIRQMVSAAKERGYSYIAITDHSQSLKITNGLDEKRLLAQVRAIDSLNAKLKNFRVLKSSEVDIKEDGSLDYPSSVLRELDFTICSIHSRFGLNKKKQTERILRAMDNRFFNVLGHATGRLLLKRPPYEIDMKRILRHAQETGCHFEINSSPDRLDLSDVHARMAKELGIKIAISTDAHSAEELGFITAGIMQARRAWLEPGDVLNTRSVAALLKLLRR